MLNKILFIAAALTAATPAVAQTNAAFVGPRVELNAGVQDVRHADVNDFTYGVALGADAPIGDRFTIGGELAADNVVSHNRTLGVGARLGYALSPNVLGYGRVGYSNLDLGRHGGHLDGLNAGAGLAFAITPNLYTNVEYRYTDFENHVGSHGARVGIGFRF